MNRRMKEQGSEMPRKDMGGSSRKMSQCLVRITCHILGEEVLSVSGSLNACRKVRVVETRKGKLGSENEEPAPPPEELESYL